MVVCAHFDECSDLCTMMRKSKLKNGDLLCVFVCRAAPPRSRQLTAQRDSGAALN